MGRTTTRGGARVGRAVGLLAVVALALSATLGSLPSEVQHPLASRGVLSGLSTGGLFGLARADEGADGETFTFQAEVSRLLDIIVNSLYSNKDVFLRELISNASDALDKIRLLALTKTDALSTGKDLEVRISADAEHGVLTISDTGIGMTKAHLVQHLGTIAKSGTSAFIDTVAKGGDMNLIGQFGVGFYSAFLAAEKVQVISKHNDDDVIHVWESAADGNFNVYEYAGPPAEVEAEAGEEGSAYAQGFALGRGTQLNLFLKEDAREYLDVNVLGKLVTQYSQFINYPIFLLEEEQRDIEVEVGEDGEEELDLEDDEEDGEDGEDGDDGEEEEVRVITKTVTEPVWRRKNAAKAIWLRSPSEVAEEDYAEFFKVISKGQFHSEPEALAKTHFKAEGDVEFRSILYIPKEKPFELHDNSNTAMMSRIKLYVRRVFISDSFDDLIPKYLSFVIGLVDSDTLPLNVNRESLQHHASLKTIKKKLIRKTLDMMKKIADDEKRAIAGEGAGEDGEDAGAVEEGATKKFTEFWKNYGQYLKMGVIEDHANRIRLSKLLRFKSSHADFSQDDDAFTDFESYVSRMKEGQKKLYYLIGSSLEELKASAFAERLVSEGYEIIYFTEAMDEYLMQHLVEFNDFKFENAAKEEDGPQS